MELNNLEEIITKQMQNIYKKTARCHFTERDNLNNGKIIRSFDIISGSDLIGYRDIRQEITNPIERAREALLNNHIGCVYMDRTIHLCVDETWSDVETYNFLNKTIGQKDIVDAINSECLQLQIKGLNRDNPLVIQKEIPFYEWRAAQRNNWNIFRMVDNLREIGLEVKLEN